MLIEHAARLEAPPLIQVFASDLHSQSLDKAREGLYPGDIEGDVGPERLRRFFLKENGGYRVRKEVRELVIFAPHNVLSDPPFSRLDLISCRNVLIYLQRELQQQVIELFHYALQPDGYLLLGTSETVAAQELFRLEDKKSCIHRKRNVSAPEPRLPVFPLMRSRTRDLPARSDTSTEPLAYGTLHQRMMERYAPPSLLISPDDHVVYYSPGVGRYLVHPGGAPTTSLFKLIRSELRLELRVALPSARLQHKLLRTKPTDVRFNGKPTPVVVDIVPATDGEDDGFVLLVFQEHRDITASATELSSGSVAKPSEGETRERDAQRQLAERLQAIIEEYETSQEEIKASNEELQSANEELRSTMEELETSKEELQSMNEELQTVNQENRHKVEELDQLSSDLQNLLVATDIATLFLDRELRILRFTPKIAELFNVRITDRGRPLSDFTHRLGYDVLQDDAASVLDRLIPIERETRDDAGHWYLTRLLPYRSGEDRIAGVVVTFVEITQQKNVEEQLRQAKEHFEHIIVVMPEPLLVLTSDLRVDTANAAFCEQFKFGTDQVKGRKLHELSGGDWNIPALQSVLDRALATEAQVGGIVIDHTFAQLGRRVLLVNARALRGTGLLVLGIHDITERFKAEQAVRANETRYRALAELSPEAILVYAGGRYVFANPAAARLLAARDAEDLIGRSVFEVIEPEFHESVRRSVREVLEQRRSTERTVYPWRRLDGRRVDAEVAAGPVDWEGQPAVQILARDVTERKQAEAALRESEQRYRRLFESIDEGFCVIEVLFDAHDRPCDYRFVEVNPAFVKQTGIEDAVGRHMREIAPLHEEYWFQRYAKVARTGEPTRFDSFAAQLGRHYEVYAYPVGAREEHQVAILFNDITVRKRMEEQLLKSTNELREANRRKDEYLAMLGHELRNPLAAIRGATARIKRDASDVARVNSASEVLERQSEHMTEIIDGLLDVSRIVQGKIMLDLQSLDLRVVLGSVLQDRGDQLKAKKLSLEHEPSDEPLWIKGDRTRLTQVLDNLVGNAIKFSEPGGTVSVSARRSDRHVSIRVRDTGVGIRPEMQERIFESFQQEAQDASRSAGGLGLGLSLAKGLVELHGGNVTVRSEGPGKGAEFEVRLPLAQAHPAPPKSPADTPDGAPRRILVVEDNADVAEVLSGLLEDEGHAVKVVDRAADALTAMREGRFDIVLCDVGLPGMSGYDFAQEVRKDPKLAQTALIAVTGYGQKEDRDRAQEAGFDEHIVKPLRMSVLNEVITRVGRRESESST